MITVLAGYKNGVCRAVHRNDRLGADKTKFLARAADKGWDVRNVSIEQAINDSEQGFKRSVRMLKAAMERERKLIEQLQAEGSLP